MLSFLKAETKRERVCFVDLNAGGENISGSLGNGFPAFRHSQTPGDYLKGAYYHTFLPGILISQD